MQLLNQTEALLSGHFLLSSGLHSEQYLQCAKVQRYPQVLEQLGRALADRWSDREFTVVIGPAMGGIVLAYELARHLDARGIFMERGKDGTFELRRGFEVKPDDRVLIAEDVVTTGGSVREVLQKIALDNIVSKGYSFQEEMLWHCSGRGFVIGEVPIIFVDRTRGTSKISWREIWGGVWTVLRLAFTSARRKEPPAT